MRILNLGAGNRISPEAGAINHDITKHRAEINAVWDLDITPWNKYPLFDDEYELWEDNSFDQIQFISVIEHLRITPIEALNECWRLLRAGGELLLKYPIIGSETIHDDPTHRWFLTPRSIEYVCPDLPYGKTYNFYTPFKWKLLSGGIIKGRDYKARMTPLKG